jgi:hypothetical protein
MRYHDLDSSHSGEDIFPVDYSFHMHVERGVFTSNAKGRRQGCRHWSGPAFVCLFASGCLVFTDAALDNAMCGVVSRCSCHLPAPPLFAQGTPCAKYYYSSFIQLHVIE